MTFGEKIKDARKSKKLTQKQLSEKIGVAHNSISDWENGKNKPDSNTIELLCNVLEITPNYLLTSSPEEFTPSEIMLIKNYRALDSLGQELVDLTIKSEVKRTEQLKERLAMYNEKIARHIPYEQTADDCQQQPIETKNQ
ncbi:MAG: helix-turn-helix domain-containing protein [Lachnospiraceae bacterium]|nr:helix-turn-helix domain-containing protein [Lachnospiraceae bacterium]